MQARYENDKRDGRGQVRLFYAYEILVKHIRYTYTCIWDSEYKIAIL